MKRLAQNAKGFTLVELMIVVAIIGILAAIAIPQFAAYRIRGFNSSALSDTRNISTTQAALFADWQRFGVTAEEAAATPFDPANPPAPAANALVTGGNDAGDGIVCTDANATDRGTAIALGNGIIAVSHVDAVALATTFTAGAKHTQGDTVFAVDADSSSVFQDPTTRKSGDPMVAADILAANANADDFTGKGTWVIK